MREVKNKSITNKLVLLTLAFCLAFPFMSIAQYSKLDTTSDSLKKAILIHSNILYPPVDIKGLKVDRKKMPIFCKWELDIQDQTRIPVKFRLGSQDYVDLLEQKNKHY